MDDFFQDVASTCGPDEGLGILVVSKDKELDCCDQFIDTFKHTPFEPILAEISEESLHHIHPRSAGCGEVRVKALVLSQPLQNLGMLVGRIVVQHHMDL